MAVDDDDPYFGVTANRDDVQTYFQARIAAPLKRLGVSVSLSLVAFQNDAHKPGPAFNVAAAVAYADGADFLFRLNDDTVLGERWASALVAALVNNDPPLVGVAGPACTGNRANTDILTHDFVHRTHLDIFPTYCEQALFFHTKPHAFAPVATQPPVKRRLCAGRPRCSCRLVDGRLDIGCIRQRANVHRHRDNRRPPHLGVALRCTDGPCLLPGTANSGGQATNPGALGISVNGLTGHGVSGSFSTTIYIYYTTAWAWAPLGCRLIS